MSNFFDIREILLTIPGVLIGISFHEFAHAITSYKLGDPTPKIQGRLSLSPKSHIDPIGLIFLLLVGFGWGRPVMIDPRHYKNPKRDETLVSFAGPVANIITAFVFAGIIKLCLMLNLELFMSEIIFSSLLELLYGVVSMNVVLAIFNLIPIPPLDGFHILANWLPLRFHRFLFNLSRYGNIILILLIVTKLIDLLIEPPIRGIIDFILSFYGIR